MKNKKSVQDLQNTINDGILSFMKEKGFNRVEFKTPFRIYVEEQSFDDDYVRVPYGASSLSQDGTVLITNEYCDDEINVRAMDIYESAHILDALESGDYEIDEDDEFIDPAGGRGLESHI